MDFVVLVDHRINLKECEKKYKYLDFTKELKKTMEHEGNDYANREWCFLYSNYRIIKGTVVGGQVKTIQTTALFGIVQNTEKSPGDLRRLAVTQTPVKDH